MNNRYLFFRFLIACLPCFAGTTLAQSTQPIKITYPESRAVFQRENDNTATIYLSGNYYQAVDSVQARVQAEVSGQGINTNWTTIQRNPQGGVFQGSLRAQGGWYRLEVRALSAGVELGTSEVRKIGIGEVFIITGQSNAQGFQNFGAPAAADDRVNCVTFDNTTANSLGDPPSPMFQQLSASSLIGPRGQSAWCWGVLGDLIAKQYNVPVLFINTAWQATVIRNWRESSEGKITKNIFAIGTPYENFPDGMPYGNLITALRYYCSLQGLRAVLWQQGENDNVPLNSTRQAYAEDMQYLVNKTRADTKRYPAWVLARSSYNSGKVSQEIIQAQNDVINTYNNNVFAGPYTDNIQIPRFEGEVHFGGDGLRQLGQAWFESLSSVFFQSSRPLPALAPPTVTVSCATSNNNLTLTLPTLYRSYNWRTGQTSRSINVSESGIYRAVLKDETGNTYLSPTVDVQGAIQPATPVISLANQPATPAAAQQQICADSALTLATTTTGTSTAFWSTSAVGNTLRINQSGQYRAQAINVYGCRSAQSSPVTLTVRSKLPAPSIEQIGTFTLQAVLPVSTGGQTDLYDWRRGNEIIPQNSAVVKVVVTANYSARTKSEFSLNNNNLTCYSDFSAPKAFTFDGSNGGLSIYPNPTSDGVVTIETIENLENAAVTIYSLSGARVFATQVPILNERKALDISNLSQGVYIIRVQSASFDLSKRLIINR
ncbi:T9SS type A sorting domain-containing protein [Spirosoma sp. KUDC1026]|uniref:T9SS type A sorting domain-containing protein n=1 Tax=Spirosoma sp. KUDC1026 TaxID=2745947 RepID=UPI00159BDF29|nr:T9SS type A sorting domain-containing protein [Spirosoma sp. KUDC1026]QKZ11832.1 T9SS type A sorting domain-containing protein [Spirosoma sp. KUDC1026]